MGGGLVPITRAFLSSYYDKHHFPPLSDEVSRISHELHNLSNNLRDTSLPIPQEKKCLLNEVESQAPHKIDENMWKNREQIEEIIFLLETSHWPKSVRSKIFQVIKFNYKFRISLRFQYSLVGEVPDKLRLGHVTFGFQHVLKVQEQSTPEDVELAHRLRQLKEKCRGVLKLVESFQSKSSENVFNTDNMVVDAYAVMTYMPQDFRGTLIRKQRERSEKNKRAEVDALVNSGGSIHERYALLWQQQMERRRQLAQLGSAAGVYKTVVKYLVGVPQVLLDFVRQINDDQGPMEEQRHRYGPPMEVFANSPFFVTAEEAGTIEANRIDDYNDTNIPAGTTYEVSLEVESVNSYIAWDFSVAQGRISMDIGFSIEYTDSLGQKTLILHYRRYDSDQGNFCTIMAGNYKLIWDNSHSTFFRKALRYKVDCIPPVVEPEAQERGTI
ncbi:GOLD domain-containing protein [Artemisia annua]|uniref:GOLD domain-containing protein n=1 Tax=Artemisia annua TaxID=35608 RepID=A0A2U1PJM5_ARTAN|nr:GOLD domain-containing protein [Artemisia annua]